MVLFLTILIPNNGKSSEICKLSIQKIAMAAWALWPILQNLLFSP